MKMRTLIRAGFWSIIVLMLAACANEDMQQKEETKQNGEHVVATFTGHQPKTPGSAKSRTTATYSMGGSNAAQVSWEATDKIWVKDINGTFHQSDAAIFPTISNKARANFKLANGNYGFNPEVRFTNTGNPNTVSIAFQQLQSGSDNFNHLGVSGDCGIATAIGGGGDYEFTLQHKASYICFLPRNMNKELVPSNFQLMRIAITANKPIVGTYDFSDGSLVGKSPIANGNSFAFLIPKHPNYPKLSTQQDGDQSGCYFVIAPGTYNLSVNFWFEDPNTHEGISIPKEYPNLTCSEGKIVELTANLTLPVWGKYYMWDAQQHYWWGHETEQPLTNGANSPNWPKNKTSDPQRWHNDNDPGTGKIFEGQTDLFRSIPNINEMLWYVYHGDPHWENPKPRLMLRDGHIVQVNMGGLWLKKKAKIMADMGITENQMKEGYPKVSPTDWRATPITTLPAAIAPSTAPLPNTKDYFFLPAMGQFRGLGTLTDAITSGYYWTSTASFKYRTNQFYLEFNSGSVRLVFGRGYYGFQAMPFE